MKKYMQGTTDMKEFKKLANEFLEGSKYASFKETYRVDLFGETYGSVGVKLIAEMDGEEKVLSFDMSKAHPRPASVMMDALEAFWTNWDADDEDYDAEYDEWKDVPDYRRIGEHP